MSDDPLREAFRALRDRSDGSHVDPEASLERALARTRHTQKKRSVVRWVVLPMAAALLVSTAWARVSGKLSFFVRDVEPMLAGERTRPPEAPAPQPSQVSAPAPNPSADAVTPPPEPAPTTVAAPPVITAQPPQASTASVVLAPPPPPPAPPNEPQPAERPQSSDPNAALFAEAHRVHFVEQDADRAVRAWDAYLAAAPEGRFALEARYNRALALVRLGRAGEARRALEPFASGAFGSYRREQATALLEALARDR